MHKSCTISLRFNFMVRVGCNDTKAVRKTCADVKTGGG